MELHLNFLTTASGLQQEMEGALEKRAGRVFGPPAGRKLIYFVDDLNMPALDKSSWHLLFQPYI